MFVCFHRRFGEPLAVESSNNHVRKDNSGVRCSPFVEKMPFILANEPHAFRDV
jgi:hypothetical protein